MDHIVGPYLTFNSPHNIKVYYLLMHRQFLWNFVKLIFIKYHSLKKLSGIKHWIRWVQHIPKGSSTYLKSCMVQTFFGGFTDVYGDNNISADKRTQVIVVSFFLSHSWLKNIMGYLLQYIEIDRLKLYEGKKQELRTCRTYFKSSDHKVFQWVL